MIKRFKGSHPEPSCPSCVSGLELWNQKSHNIMTNVVSSNPPRPCEKKSLPELRSYNRVQELRHWPCMRPILVQIPALPIVPWTLLEVNFVHTARSNPCVQPGMTYKQANKHDFSIEGQWAGHLSYKSWPYRFSWEPQEVTPEHRTKSKFWNRRVDLKPNNKKIKQKRRSWSLTAWFNMRKQKWWLEEMMPPNRVRTDWEETWVKLS